MKKNQENNKPTNKEEQNEKKLLKTHFILVGIFGLLTIIVILVLIFRK